TSCGTLAMIDSLNAFDWVCEVVGGKATFYSTTLKIHKGLRDLVTATAWRKAKVILREGSTPVAQSEELAWWSNAVEEAPALSIVAVLDGVDDDGAGPDRSFAPGTVLTFDGNASTGGYNINADRLTLVGLNSAVLSWAAGAGNNCSSATGEATGADRRCLIAAGSQKFIWLEGFYDGLDQADHGLLLVSTRFAGVKNFKASNTSAPALQISQSSYNTFANAVAHDSASDGVQLVDSSYNAFALFASYGNGRDGFRIGPNAPDTYLYLAFAQDNTGRGVFVQDSARFYIGLSNASRNDGVGLELSNSPESRAQLVGAQASGGAGVRVHTGSHDFSAYILTSAGNAGPGFWAESSDDMRLIGLQASSNQGTGALIESSSEPLVVGAVVANNQGAGLHLNSSLGATVSHVNAFSNSLSGVLIAADNSTLNQLLASNNGGSGLELTGSSAVLSQLHLAHNVVGVTLSGSSSNVFTRVLGVGNNGADCSVTGGVNPGLTAACANQGGSSATLVSGRSHVSSYLGKVTATDTFNGTNTNGTQAYARTNSWMSFITGPRHFGIDGGAFPDAAARGACSSGTCRIWDLRLSASDTQVLNRTGDGSSANGAFTPGAACPAYLSGNMTSVDQKSSPNVFLVNASERMEDGVGDEDGLCESAEACIASPNFGLYQGESLDTGGTCTFQDGGVTGVTLYRYSVNGR
ncbi:MAG TPA: right-handed parallel beta-helix repeat-containing protein, partial [Bdellovibrionales bacterium]|nr:right-handed parallel beta-helix repeat-containing protein [Bdellovibrionales bacterium]